MKEPLVWRFEREDWFEVEAILYEHLPFFHWKHWEHLQLWEVASCQVIDQMQRFSCRLTIEKFESWHENAVMISLNSH